MSADEKRCTKCGTTKSLSEFKLQKRKTGFFPTAWCRDCSNKASREYMRAHANDPAKIAARLERDRARYNRLKDDPEFREKERARGRDYCARPEVKERVAKTSRQWVIDNPEKAAEKQRRWVEANRDRARKYWSAYYKTPHGRARHRLQQSKRRAMLRGVLCDLTNEQVDRVFEIWENACAYCSGAADTIDHLVPIMRGGPHTMTNIVPACRSCNSRKRDGDVPPKAWPKIRAMLTRYC